MSTYTCPHCGERGLSTQRRHWCPKAPPISQLLRLGPPRSRDPIANEYIARLTRELQEARERERALREAHERSVGVFRRACEIAEAAIVAGETPETASARLRDAIEADIAEINALVALATPQEAGGAD